MRKQTKVVAAVAGISVCLCLLGVAGAGILIAVFWPRLDSGQSKVKFADGKSEKPTKGKNDAKDRDYFRLLEVTYERHAMLSMELTWLDDYKESFEDYDKRSANLVASQAKSKAELLEFKQNLLRQAFVKDHGVDSKEWTASFKKRFPERDVIFDEVKIMARNSCRTQALEVRLHFDDKRKTMALLAWKDYRVDYLRDNAPKWMDQLLQETKKLDSIRHLERKSLPNSHRGLLANVSPPASSDLLNPRTRTRRGDGRRRGEVHRECGA